MSIFSLRFHFQHQARFQFNHNLLIKNGDPVDQPSGDDLAVLRNGCRHFFHEINHVIHVGLHVCCLITYKGNSIRDEVTQIRHEVTLGIAENKKVKESRKNGGECPYAIGNWENNWQDVNSFFSFPVKSAGLCTRQISSKG